MYRRIEDIIEDQLASEKYIISVLDDAAYAERFLAKPNNNRCPSMYKILETYYDPKDWGYYTGPKMVLRASPKQMSRYELAIDILLMIKEDISDNPFEMRKVFWLRANRFAWSKIAKMFFCHRTTIKRRYYNVLQQLVIKFKKHLTNKTKIH